VAEIRLTSRERFAVPPRVIIFDIGRVIVRVNLNRLFEPLAALLPLSSGAPRSPKLSPQEIWSAIQADPRWLDWQEGRMTPHQWHEHLAGRLRVRIGFAEFCHAWNRALDPDLILGEELFETLGKRYRLGLLSNTDPLHSAHLESRFPFVRHFPTRVYSCAIGASKPSPVIFRAALDALGISPGEGLYIDDIPEYAQAARQVGLNAIRFEGSAQLLEEFHCRGLLGDAQTRH
jgi:HAD superfamily hydrolase (TIGR01509 family)